MAEPVSENSSGLVRATDEHAADAHLPGTIPVARRGTESARTFLPHARRFRVGRTALFAIAIAALAVAVAIAVSPTRSTGGSGSWSTWKPPDSGLAGAQEIADYIAPYYRATPSAQLAVVSAVNLNSSSSPQVAIPASGTASGSGAATRTQQTLVPLPGSSTILYNLCGTGTGNCAIGAGTPSSARLLLLRREALELALYTFKYISGTQTVVAILPPGRTAQGCTGICPKPQTGLTTKPVNLALAFDRRELQPWLARPLRQALPEAIPPTVTQMPTAPEAELVSVITAQGLFSERVESAQDGGSLIVLSQQPPQ